MEGTLQNWMWWILFLFPIYSLCFYGYHGGGCVCQTPIPTISFILIMQASIHAIAASSPSLDSVSLYGPLTLFWTEAVHMKLCWQESISTYKLGHVDSLDFLLFLPHIFDSWKPTHGKRPFLKHCAVVRQCNGFYTVIWGTVFSLKSPPWLSLPGSFSGFQQWHAWIQMLWDPVLYCWILPVSRLRTVSSDRTLGQWDNVPGKQGSTVQYLHALGRSLST